MRRIELLPACCASHRHVLSSAWAGTEKRTRVQQLCSVLDVSLPPFVSLLLQGSEVGPATYSATLLSAREAAQVDRAPLDFTSVLLETAEVFEGHGEAGPCDVPSEVLWESQQDGHLPVLALCCLLAYPRRNFQLSVRTLCLGSCFSVQLWQAQREGSSAEWTL